MIENKTVGIEKANKLLKNIYENLDNKKINKETIDLYQDIVDDSRRIVIGNKNNVTEPKLKMLDIFRLLAEVLMGIKTKEPHTKSESEKLDIAQGGKSESESDEKIEGKGLKLMARKKMITRLPTLLAQLKAGNNSQKLKNEIRQIVYSLYRS